MNQGASVILILFLAALVYLAAKGKLSQMWAVLKA